MSNRGTKRWHFELKLGGLRGIAVVQGSNEITDRRNRSLGPLTDVCTPKTRKGCSQAENFLPYAVQVSPHHGLQFRLNHSVSFHDNHVLQERTALFFYIYLTLLSHVLYRTEGLGMRLSICLNLGSLCVMGVYW